MPDPIPRTANDKPGICIISQNAYGAMCGGRNGHVGGAEHQTTFLARWLASQGYPTSLLTWDEGQAEGSVIDGVKLRKICSASSGLPVLRFFHPRLTGLYAAMRRAGADIYYHNSAEHVTGLAALWCRLHDRKFVYSVASDVACDSKLPAMSRPDERLLYRLGLRLADQIIVQTQRQQTLLQNGFGLRSVQLPMPCASPAESDVSVPPAGAPRVAWVGRAAPMKRLDWMLAIAEQMPDVQFELAVANLKSSQDAPALRSQASRLANVIWHDGVPRAAMPGIYQRALCLCCTSNYEGFPNTFLEAWSFGRPVITSFDPDGLVGRLNLGVFASAQEEFIAAIRHVISTPEHWKEQSRNARAYYLANHAPCVAMARFEREFLSVSPKFAGCKAQK